MDIKEEKQKEGQRQGQKCHQHDGRQGRSQNRGKDFELLFTLQKNNLSHMLIRCFTYCRNILFLLNLSC